MVTFSVHLLYQEFKCWAEVVATSLSSAVVLPTVDEKARFELATELPHTV